MTSGRSQAASAATTSSVLAISASRPRSSLDARLHADLPHKQLRSLLCAQLSAVQAAADPNVSSPGSLSDTLHRRSTGIRKGSLGTPLFRSSPGRAASSTGPCRSPPMVPPSSRGRLVVKSAKHRALRTEDRGLRHPRLRHRPTGSPRHKPKLGLAVNFTPTKRLGRRPSGRDVPADQA